MKATQLLKRQHDEVKQLFKKLEKASAAKDKRGIFEEIAANLVGHDAIEREIFYPACEATLGMTDQLAEALVEHGVVEFCLYQADEAKPGDEFDAKATVLKEMLEHHIEEEEGEFFPKVEKAMGASRLEALGAQMEARFAKAMSQSFRRPLHANLRQVLAGAMKTKPAAKKPVARKTARKTPAHARARRAA
jgi:hemerythrin-like domain-containing protein